MTKEDSAGVEIKQGSGLCEAQYKPPEYIQQKVLRLRKRVTGKGISGGKRPDN